MCGNYLYVYIVCMYTLILPQHFVVTIYSPWQKTVIKRGAGPEYIMDFGHWAFYAKM